MTIFDALKRRFEHFNSAPIYHITESDRHIGLYTTLVYTLCRMSPELLATEIGDIDENMLFSNDPGVFADYLTRKEVQKCLTPLSSQED